MEANTEERIEVERDRLARMDWDVMAAKENEEVMGIRW